MCGATQIAIVNLQYASLDVSLNRHKVCSMTVL